MGNTFRLWAGGVDAVEGVFGNAGSADQIDGPEARDQAQPGDGRVHGPEENREIQICAPGKGLSGAPNEQAFLEVRIGNPKILDAF